MQSRKHLRVLVYVCVYVCECLFVISWISCVCVCVFVFCVFLTLWVCDTFRIVFNLQIPLIFVHNLSSSLKSHYSYEPDTQDTAGEARTSSWVTYSYEPSHMEQNLDDQLEHTYSSYERIWDVALKTYQRRWKIGRSGERGSGISVLTARHDDDDDDDEWYSWETDYFSALKEDQQLWIFIHLCSSPTRVMRNTNT